MTSGRFKNIQKDFERILKEDPPEDPLEDPPEDPREDSLESELASRWNLEPRPTSAPGWNLRVPGPQAQHENETP